MSFFSYFRLHRNKFLAVTFSALSLVLFFVYYGMQVGFNGFAFFTNNPFELWNFIIVLIAYFTIFYCNVTNDNAAYRGIVMFVFMIVVSQMMNLFPNFFLTIDQFFTSDPVVIAFTLLQLAFLIAQVVVGVMLYLRAQGYRMMRYDDFSKVRLLAILFASMLALSLLSSIVATAVGTKFSTPLDAAFFYVTLFSLPLSEVLMAVSVVFTFERLRRD